MQLIKQTFTHKGTEIKATVEYVNSQPSRLVSVQIGDKSYSNLDILKELDRTVKAMLATVFPEEWQKFIFNAFDRLEIGDKCWIAVYAFETKEGQSPLALLSGIVADKDRTDYSIRVNIAAWFFDVRIRFPFNSKTFSIGPETYFISVVPHHDAPVIDPEVLSATVNKWFSFIKNSKTMTSEVVTMKKVLIDIVRNHGEY